MARTTKKTAATTTFRTGDAPPNQALEGLPPSAMKVLTALGQYLTDATPGRDGRTVNESHARALAGLLHADAADADAMVQQISAAVRDWQTAQQAQPVAMPIP